MDEEPTRRRERPSSVHPAAESGDRSRQGAGSKCGPCRSCWQGAKPPAGIIEYPSDSDFNISTDIMSARDGGRRRNKKCEIIPEPPAGSVMLSCPHWIDKSVCDAGSANPRLIFDCACRHKGRIGRDLAGWRATFCVVVARRRISEGLFTKPLSTVIISANSGKPRCQCCFGYQRFLWGHFSSWRGSPANDPWLCLEGLCCQTTQGKATWSWAWQGKLLTCGGAATRKLSGTALSVIPSISKNMVASTGCCGITKDWWNSRLARRHGSSSSHSRGRLGHGLMGTRARCCGPACNAADRAYSRGPRPHPSHADWQAKTRHISGFDPPLSCAFEGAANDFQT